MEEKIHITETEEITLEEEIPLTVPEICVKKVESDGKEIIKFILFPTALSCCPCTCSFNSFLFPLFV